MMWRRWVCCNCQVDESDKRENRHIKATTNNVDGMFISTYLTVLTLLTRVDHVSAALSKLCFSATDHLHRF